MELTKDQSFSTEVVNFSPENTYHLKRLLRKYTGEIIVRYGLFLTRQLDHDNEPAIQYSAIPGEIVLPGIDADQIQITDDRMLVAGHIQPSNANDNKAVFIRNLIFLHAEVYFQTPDCLFKMNMRDGLMHIRVKNELFGNVKKSVRIK